MHLARPIACSSIVTGLALFRVDALIRLGPVPPPPDVSSWGFGSVGLPEAPGERADSHPLTRFWKRPSPRSKPIPPLLETTFRKFPERRGV